MDRLIYTAMTGANQALSRQAAVANNLANINTDGYKAAEHRARAVQIIPGVSPVQSSLGTRAFAVDATTHTDFKAGPLMATGKPLDIAARGTAWIAVSLPDGSEAYTRAGRLQVGPTGELLTAGGLPVLGDGGPIVIPPDGRVSIGEDGTVSLVPETGLANAVTPVGRIKLVEPAPGELSRGVDGNFRPPGGGALPASDSAKVISGFVEGSNVSPAEQMVTMISLARQFEMQIKLLQTADANDRAATQVLSPR